MHPHIALASSLLVSAALAATASAQVIHAFEEPGGAKDVVAAQRAAKKAAEFTFLGTLARTCFLPPSRSEDLRDIVPDFVADPGKAPPRSSWYAEPAKVFDNLYFVGGKIHSAWALKTNDGIILLDTIYTYNSEELILGRSTKGAQQIVSV